MRSSNDLPLNTYVDPCLGLAEPEDVVWGSMGEGPHVRAAMEVLGLKMRPAFPAQQPLSVDSHRRIREGYRRSGIPASVDWHGDLAAPRRNTRPPDRKIAVPKSGGMSAQPGNVGAV